ncbi:MAG: hypothetical protein ABI432_02475 [Flavobacteriales bacterium]
MTNPFLSGTSVQEIILDDFSRPVAWQMQLATAEVDNRLHRVLERDAVYMNGRLASYKRMELDHRSDTLLYVVVELEYDSSGRLTSLIERTNGYYSYTKPNASTGMSERVNVDPKESQVINKWAYRFDPDGKLSTLTQCRLGEQYSVEERSLVLIYSFEYDKQGNWTKKFVQAGSEPRKISEAQSIKYRKRK